MDPHGILLKFLNLIFLSILIGNTDVLVGIKVALGEPNYLNPDKGIINVSVDWYKI